MDNFNQLNNIFEKAKNAPVEASFNEVKSTFSNTKNVTPLEVDLGKKPFFSVKNLFIMTSIITAVSLALIFGLNQPEISKAKSNTKETKKVNSVQIENEIQNQLENISKIKEPIEEDEIENLTVEQLELKALEINSFLKEFNDLELSKHKSISTNKRNSSLVKFPKLTVEEIKENNKRKEKVFKKKKNSLFPGYNYIPSGAFKYLDETVSVYAFCVKQTEVTNLEYKTFLFDLLIHDRKDEFLKAAPNQNGWVEVVGDEAKAIADQYFWHEDYFDYPVVNVSLEGAQMYCKWLTEENAKVATDRYDKYLFRLPYRTEWSRAAMGDKKDMIYPWDGNKTFDDDNLPLANFTKENSAKSSYTVEVNSYHPNGWGLYNLSGNVAEMVFYRGLFNSHVKDGFGTAGGGWMDPSDNLKIAKIKYVPDSLLSSPNIGFRVVFSHLNKRFSQAIRNAHYNDELPVLLDLEVRENNKLKSKLLKSIISPSHAYLSAVPSGELKSKNGDKTIQSFLIQKTEVKSEEYKIFLYDLLIQGRNQEYKKALPKFSYKKKGDKRSKFEMTMDNSLFERGKISPINAISREGAELYCKWLNEEIKKAYPKENINPVRIPQREEIQYAGQYWKYKNKELDSDGFYPEGNYLLNDSTSTYQLVNDSYTFVSHNNFKFTGNTINGILNLKGNLAEMCYDGKKPGTVGGSWADPKEQMDLFAPDNNTGVTEPRGNIGFRIVITVTDNKSQKKFLKKYGER